MFDLIFDDGVYVAFVATIKTKHHLKPNMTSAIHTHKLKVKSKLSAGGYESLSIEFCAVSDSSYYRSLLLVFTHAECLINSVSDRVSTQQNVGGAYLQLLGRLTKLFIFGHACRTRLAVPEVWRQWKIPNICSHAWIFSVWKARILKVLKHIRGEVEVVLQVRECLSSCPPPDSVIL